MELNLYRKLIKNKTFNISFLRTTLQRTYSLKQISAIAVSNNMKTFKEKWWDS